jgi:ribosome maturation factor RimP
MKANLAIDLLFAPTVAALGYELLGCVYASAKGGAILRVYIDSEKGVNVDDCERVSRQLSALLDVEDPLPGNYRLEVSSPGLDRPLFTPDHFRRFIGEKVNIQLHAPINNRRHIKGILLEIENENVILSVDNEKMSLPFSNILKANLQFELPLKQKLKR